MLFVDLDLQRANAELAAVTNHRYKSGDTLYSVGEEAGALLSIRKGIVKLTLLSPEGDVRIVRLLGPGAVIGLEALVESVREHTAQCMSAVDFCRIPVRAMQQLLSDQPMLYDALIQRWHDHTESADRHLFSFTSGSVKARTARLLERMNELYQLGGSPLVLPQNIDCASIIGARIESVSRVMAEFKRSGALSRVVTGGWSFNPELIPSDP